MRKKNKTAAISGLALMIFLVLVQPPSYAGFGNLFGGANDGKDGEPNGTTSPNTPPGAIGTVDGDDGTARHSDKPSKSGSGGGGKGAGPTGTDYTDDEKRMQGRYSGDLENAKKTVEKGERMMKSHDPKVAKKGALFKQIGEKELARLKENNPFPAQHSIEDKPRGTGSKPDSL